MAIKPGNFIITNYNKLGVGKVIAINEDIATIEYFESVSRKTRHELPLRVLNKITLETQTRCYLYDEDRDLWLIGRIMGRFGDQYDVALPDKSGGYYDAKHINVRCNLPVSDPTDVLAMKGHETGFFHWKRTQFVHELIKQRAVSRGMPGLISSRIDLYAHQVEVVRRVLEDPVHRYLLADEVGLGKTIETGIILRQILLDDPQCKVLLIVPPQLTDQWRQELRNKFGLTESQNFEIKGTDELDFIRVTDRGMVVIDEAQHVAAQAFSKSLVEQERYQKYVGICHKSDGLLLLSATPVLNNEDAFLAMLHLLEPDYYSLDDREAFREKINKRQEIGRILLSFNEGSVPFILKRNLKKIATIFPDDIILRELAKDLEVKLQSDEVDQADCDQLIRAIRLHISDTYRLHRRMLRNRRDSITDFVLPGRSTEGNRALTTTECDLGMISADVNDLLDAWRDAAFGEVLRLESSFSDEIPFRKKELTSLFLLLFEVAGSSLSLFKKLLLARLGKDIPEELYADIGPEGVQLLQEVEYFEHETEILEGLLRAIEQPDEDGDRIDLLIEVLNKEVEKKCLVFTSYVSVGQEIANRLTEVFGEDCVACYLKDMDSNDVRKSVVRFTTNPKCFVMVADISGEEGRNLQEAEVIIHFDVPWSPNRIEQRIGRVDRIGKKHAIRSYVFVGPDVENSLYDAWYRVLCYGIEVFTKSVASLQFYIDRKTQELTFEFFANGAGGLIEAIEDIKHEVEQEKVKIKEQQALDEIDALTKNAQQYYLPLMKYEEDPETIRGAMEPWICDALQFRRDGADERVFRYSASRKTLIPISWLYRINRSQEGPGTYYRTAVNTNNCSLFRIGESFIDTMGQYIRWDDRGQVFAIWRWIPSWDDAEGAEWLGFRFDYIVEADVNAAIEKLPKGKRGNIQALRRRADAYFPPQFITVFIGTELKEVIDHELIEILSLPFEKSRDINLTKDRLEIIDTLIDPSIWPNLCRQAREESERIIKQRPAFINLCRGYSLEARKGFEHRILQLSLRNEQEKQLKGSHRTVSNEDVEMERKLCEALIGGIEKPKMTIDSVGFICISGRNAK